ncbi:hypothetical protein ABID82_005249 [Methylobacterium sp. PvP062]|uniref:Uncharacterized protein n=1 Tax=Methylobacterium radiotolerans TaxID=31998 RepID=A0ABV2NQ85_9HYPH|nr:MULTISPECIES: hypothetical protein [unclassified Methylobacterium]MBP2494626.1 hypothetical protein [Methylobacterium sp. PvP105]MBP2505503.1 hypothetical protein [Methylobacterium sp. PvP109]MCX7330099.1 hypothetical protein [Hyphomicrobiales bacterium]
MVAPPPIAIEDLDREELLQLIKVRLPFNLRPAELWRARWDVLARRALEARERELEAFSAYVAAFAPIDPSSVAQSFVDPIAVRERKREERERADRAAKRLEAARDRAWDALQASHGRTAA